MKLLIRPDPFSDETLESYLLRLSEANFFESYQQFSFAVQEWLQHNDFEAAGAFPVELARLNIFHAAQHSSRRIRALKLVETLTDNENLPLLRLASLNSTVLICSRYQATYLDGTHIPLALLRRDAVPVCPECLKESAYIRQSWHWLPYRACIHHGVKLVDHCPKCGSTINYLNTEQLHTCTCGFDLRRLETEAAEPWEVKISQLVSGYQAVGDEPLFSTSSISLRFACLLWFQLFTRKKLNDHAQVDVEALQKAMDYFASWPGVLHEELSQRADMAPNLLIQDFNKTSFQSVFGNLILISQLIQEVKREKAFIFSPLLEFLIDLVDRNPKSKHPNVADLLLTVPEAAVLLETTHEQVYRLYQEGYLRLGWEARLHEKLNPGVGAFHLRDVIELRQSRGPVPETGLYSTYLPAW